MIPFVQHPLENPYPEIDRVLDNDTELGCILTEARKFPALDQAVLSNYLIFGPEWSKISRTMRAQYPNKLGTSPTAVKERFNKMTERLKVIFANR